ncbi:hypothetical protein LTR36_006548 [Oleoguttula mirabilis]|uniref:Uncharacterized protein n=1 Tax=Oleoguttula mirabilis TaxID=1507867 RepID=A0AAV9JV50_9PEZI|nr:hypothetical protein LTR36_006548 [Oleoguttula mirabilis]
MATPSPLLNLPAELRNHIYELIAKTRPIRVRSPPSGLSSAIGLHVSIALHPLVLAFRQTYRKFGAIQRDDVLKSAASLEAHVFHLNFHGLQTCIEELGLPSGGVTLRVINVINHMPSSVSAGLSSVHTEHIASCMAALEYAGGRRGFTFTIQTTTTVRRTVEPNATEHAGGGRDITVDPRTTTTTTTTVRRVVDPTTRQTPGTAHQARLARFEKIADEEGTLKRAAPDTAHASGGVDRRRGEAGAEHVDAETPRSPSRGALAPRSSRVSCEPYGANAAGRTASDETWARRVIGALGIAAVLALALWYQ